ncbi:MAG: nuclear transport factor 2 family protein [Actinobacteria bacterium]|nr:nuclear transport factor 2 family protein [Actinomycetota bacterium]
MTDDPRAAVEAHVEAFNRCDLDTVMGGFDDDAVLSTADQTVIGARAIRALFADSFAAPIAAELVVRRAVVDGDTVACEFTEHLTVEGTTHTIDVAGFFTVRRGRLARVRIYRDLADG